MTQKPKHVTPDKPGKWILEDEETCRFRKKLGEEETIYRYVAAIDYDNDDGYYSVVDMTIDLLEYDVRKVEMAFLFLGIVKPDIRQWIKERQYTTSFKRVFHILYSFFEGDHTESKRYKDFNDARKRVRTLIRADIARNGELAEALEFHIEECFEDALN